MLKVENGEVVQCRASSLDKMIRILGFQFKHYCSEMKLIYSTYGKNATPQQIEELCPEYFDRSVTATVFAGMILEAFFYDYSVVRRSKTFADKVSNKRINVEFKEIAKEILGLDGQEETEVANRLERFKDVRVHFVHNKSTEVGKYNKKNLDYLSPDGNLQLVIDILDYFHKRDSEYLLSQLVLDNLRSLQIQERGF